MPTFDESALRSQREQFLAGSPSLRAVVTLLTQAADASLRRPVYHVTAKTTCAPSGDPHDYWSPAPYWWPNPETADGLPYVLRDGERIPAAQMWGPGSEQFDRSSLQSMVDDTVVLALAGYFTRDERYFTRAAALLRAWFISPETCMNPHLRYAQVRRGHAGDRGSPSGTLDTKDFYYLLDAARLLEIEEALATKEADALRRWFCQFRGWLATSDQGRRAEASENNRGTWYDVQVAAIDSYLQDTRSLLRTLRRIDARVRVQFSQDGSQPHEVTRTLSKHYCAYNLQGWVALAHIARRIGIDLWSHQRGNGSGLANAVGWLLSFIDKDWGYQQADGFDDERLIVLAHEAAPYVGPMPALRPSTSSPWQVRQTFTAAEGIRPFWALGNAAVV